MLGPNERLRIALRDIYVFYARTDRMMLNVLRDEETMPIVKELLSGYRQYLADARDVLMAGRNLNGPTRRRVRAAIGHALTFHVWRSLAVGQGLGNAATGELMTVLVMATSNSAAQ
jgi:hypothetical protein